MHASLNSGIDCDVCPACRLQEQLEDFEEKVAGMDQHTQKLLADSTALWSSKAGQTQQAKPA